MLRLGPAVSAPRPPAASSCLEVRCTDAEGYTRHYRACPRPHPLQSVAWGEARALDGWRAEWWLAGRRGQPALAGAQVLRKAWFLPAYLPYGPAFDGTAAGRAAARALLLRLSRRSVGGLLWAPYPVPQHLPLAREVRGVPLGSRSQTGFVPLASDGEMLSRLDAKWRWSLRRALRDPRLRVAHEDPVSFVPAVLARVRALAAEKRFHPPIRPEVGTAFASVADRSGVRLVGRAVSDEGHVTNVYVTAIVGDWAHTLWSAHEPGAAAGAGRLALWSCMRAARDLGCRAYDLSGIDDAASPGVAAFKRGVRPQMLPVPRLRWLPPAWLPPSLAAALGKAVARPRSRGPAR